MSETEKKEQEEFVIKVKLIGKALKYGGFVVFGVTLGLLILLAVLQMDITWLTYGILAGVGLIIVGTIIEKVT